MARPRKGKQPPVPEPVPPTPPEEELDPDEPPAPSPEDTKALFLELMDVNVGANRFKQFLEMDAVSKWSNRGVVRWSGDEDFMSIANGRYLKEKYPFLGGGGHGPVDLDPDDYDNEAEFYDTLAVIPQETWDEFIEELESLNNYPALDEDLMSQLEMEAFDEWMKEDGVKEFRSACKKLPAFQNSLAQFALEHVTEGQVYEAYRDSEHYYESEGTSIYVDMEDVVEAVDDPLHYVLHDADNKDLEPRLLRRFLKVKAWGFKHVLADKLDKAIRAVWAHDNDVLGLYSRIGDVTLFKVLLAATPDSNYGTGDPAWYPDTVVVDRRGRFFWTVGLSESGNSANGTDEAMTLVAHRFPDLVRQITGDDPKQLTLALESKLRALEESDEADALAWFKSDGSEEVFRNEAMTLIKASELGVLRMYLDLSPQMNESAFHHYRYRYNNFVLSTAANNHYWIAERQGTGELVGVDGSDLDEALQEPGVREGLISYFTQQVAADVNGDDRQHHAQILFQLGGMPLLTKLRRRFKDLSTPGLGFMSGMAAGKAGKVTTAKRYLQDAENRVTKQGVWIIYGDWSDTLELYDEGNHRGSPRKTAETLFAGEGREWFDSQSSVHIREYTNHFGPKVWARLRELLANRTYTDDDGEEHILSKAELDAMNDRALMLFVDEYLEDQFEDIADQIRWGVDDAVADASEGAMYRYYQEALTGDTGATESKWFKAGKHPGDERVAAHDITKLGLFFPWDAIEVALENYRGESDEPWDGTVKDLLERYAPKAKIGRDDFWETPKDEDLNYMLIQRLDELEETPPPAQPQDPNQMNMPLGEARVYRIVNRLLEESYDYSCLMINLPREQAQFVQQWGQTNIRDEDVYTDPDDAGYGRETEPHVTLKWGLQIAKPNAPLRDLIGRTRTFPIKMGRVALFRSDKYDVVILQVESPWLRALNARVRGLVPNVESHPTYKPHVTIAYVKKGSCDNLEGHEVFGAEGAPLATFYATEVAFQAPGEKGDANRTTMLPLLKDNGQPKEEPALAEARKLDGPFDKLPFPSDPSRLGRDGKRSKKRKQAKLCL